MANELSPLADRLRIRFEGKLLKCSRERDETTIEVAPDSLLEVCRTLRDDPEFRFDQAVDLCGVDYLGFGDVEWDTSDISSEGFSNDIRYSSTPTVSLLIRAGSS